MELECDIDWDALPAVIARFEGYAPLFSATGDNTAGDNTAGGNTTAAPPATGAAEGKAVYNLYMARWRQSYEPTLDTALEGVSAAPYQKLFFQGKGLDIYDCQSLYELELLYAADHLPYLKDKAKQEDLFKTLRDYYGAGKGNAPANAIVTSLWEWQQRHNTWTPREEAFIALDSLIALYPRTEAITMAYQHKVELTKDAQAKYALCRQALRQFRKSPRKDFFQGTIRDLERQSLSLRMQEQVYPNSTVPVVLSHRNTPKVTFKFYTYQSNGKKGRCVKTIRVNTLAHPLGKSVTDTLSLPVPAEGRYVLRASYKDVVTSTTLYVGKIASLYKNNRGKGYVYAVDYKSGRPLEQASVQFLGITAPEQPLSLAGFTLLPTPNTDKESYEFRLTLPATPTAPADSFSEPFRVGAWESRWRPASANNIISAVALFTDRKLYYSGDTIYFKGIATQYTQGRTSMVVGRSFDILLRSSSNYRDTLAKVTCQTNEFGSFSGSFATGSYLTNGTYSLVTAGTSTQVRLENYVRPLFTVELPTTESAFAYGDTITQRGVVQNVAGFPMQNATVTYQVHRRTLVRPFLNRYYIPYFEQKPIASGTVTTDSEGTFALSFLAERPDTKEKAFSGFTVSVSVADATGETHEKEVLIPIGDYPYVLSSNLPHILNKERPGTLTLQVLNLNGIPQEVSGSYQLTQNGQPICDGTFSAEGTTQPQWNDLPSGRYTLSYQAGKVRDTDSFILLSPHDTTSPVDTTLFFLAHNVTEDNSRTSFLLGTTENKLYALAECYDGDSLLLSMPLELSHEMKRIDWPQLDSYPYPVSLRIVAIKNGAYFQEEHTFPRTQAQTLTLTLESFRDKALPNSEESFALRVTSGQKTLTPGQASQPGQETEALVSIYNASTDRLGANHFSFTPARRMAGYMPGIQHAFTNRTHPDEYVISQGRNTRAMSTLTTGRMEKAAAAPNAYIAFDQAAEAVTSEAGVDTAADAVQEEKATNPAPQEETGLRTDFAETLAFLPHLTAPVGANGTTIPVAFRTNGLLSTFNVLVMAHSKEGKVGHTQASLTVRKEVMVLPSFPLFLREGDAIDWQARTVNLTNESLQGSATISVNGRDLPAQPVTLAPNGQALLNWAYNSAQAKETGAPSASPSASPSLTVKASLESDGHRDAEQHVIPLLTRQESITRAQTVLSTGEGIITLVQKDRKSTPTLEVTTPITAAMAALPALDTPAFNNLTSWMSTFYAAQTGAWMYRRYPALGQQIVWHDDAYVAQITQKALTQFEGLQQEDGGFAWFPGMTSSYILTLFYLDKIGKMQQMDVLTDNVSKALQPLTNKAIAFVDATFEKEWDKKARNEWRQEAFPNGVARYFAVRTALNNTPTGQAYRFFLERIDTAWKGTSIMEKAQWALVYERLGHTAAYDAVVSSLREYAVRNKTVGCYFPNAVPFNDLMSSEILAHATLLLVFRHDASLCRGLQQWILLQKKNHIWGNTEGTTDVIYALLLSGTEGTTPDSAPLYEVQQHGTTFTVRNRSNVLLFASLYEQTVEDIKDLAPFSHQMSVTRRFYKVQPGTPSAPETRQLLNPGDTVTKGDLIAVQYILTNTEPRSFVQLKASRAACLVPQTETSGFQWRMGCYREVKDSYTQFFFQSLSAGEYTVEECFYVTQSGTFNNGFAQIESLYAPEYRGHSASGTLQSK